MEDKINKTVNTYIQNYNSKLSNCRTMEEVKSVITSHETFTLENTDAKKKKRAKNVIETEERCQALRANKTQCTRRKKDGCVFCGTHAKGTPYGIIELDVVVKTNKNLQVFTQEIQGILYYVDNAGNIYDTEDIINRVVNPKRVGTYDKIDNDTFVRI